MNESHLSTGPERSKAQQKVEFPTFAHFVEDILDAGLTTVRMDVFAETRSSELSFVYYVTFTVYLTAQASPGSTLYEYKETLATTVSSDTKYQEEWLTEPGKQRVLELEDQLRAVNLRIRRGRFVVPASPPH